MLVSVAAATHSTSASMAGMGSTRMCLMFVLLAPCGLNSLCHKTKFSKGLKSMHSYKHSHKCMGSLQTRKLGKSVKYPSFPWQLNDCSARVTFRKL
uniref:Uncharacterized protein n=1 Tax=Rhipicephalus microplus TaxID=6941 RepID=A0A6G5A323_RHIMP